MGKLLVHHALSDTLHLSQDNRGWWLYDKTRGMNLAMYEPTEEAAFVKALQFYQKRLSEIERAHTSLRGAVDAFVGQFIEEDNELDARFRS